MLRRWKKHSVHISFGIEFVIYVNFHRICSLFNKPFLREIIQQIYRDDWKIGKYFDTNNTVRIWSGSSFTIMMLTSVKVEMYMVMYIYGRLEFPMMVNINNITVSKELVLLQSTCYQAEPAYEKFVKQSHSILIIDWIFGLQRMLLNSDAPQKIYHIFCRF